MADLPGRDQRPTAARQARRQPVQARGQRLPGGRKRPRPSITIRCSRRPEDSAGKPMWRRRQTFLRRNPSTTQRCSQVGGTNGCGAGSTPAPRPASTRGVVVLRFAQRAGVLAIARRAATYPRSQFNRASMALRQPVAPSNVQPTWRALRKGQAPGRRHCCDARQPVQVDIHQFLPGAKTSACARPSRSAANHRGLTPGPAVGLER